MSTPAKHDIEPPAYNRWTLATVPKAVVTLVFALVAVVLAYFKALDAGTAAWPAAWQAVASVLTVVGVFLASNARFAYAKAVVAALGAVLSVLTPYLSNGLHNLTPDQWILALGALGTAFGVYVVPQQPPFLVDAPYRADLDAHDVSSLPGDAPRATD